MSALCPCAALSNASWRVRAPQPALARSALVSATTSARKSGAAFACGATQANIRVVHTNAVNRDKMILLELPELGRDSENASYHDPQSYRRKEQPKLANGGRRATKGRAHSAV